MTEAGFTKGTVRAMVSSDLELVLAWRNHPDVRRFMYSRHEITPNEHASWFESAKTKQGKHLLIFESNDQPLGFVSFNEFTQGKFADWGFYIAPGSPKGSGRELANTALVHAFKNLKLHKICGQALAYNDRSIRFHQTIGFQQEGILREHYFDGERFHNVFCFGLLNYEWQQMP